MSVAYATILAMDNEKETWFKWDYVCSYCDSNIEMTIKSNGHKHSEVCPKCYQPLTLMSVVDVTIVPSTTKEGQTMETETTMNTLPLTDVEKYDPTLLVTYKKIHAYSDPEYVTEKITNIEWELSNARHNAKVVSSLQSKINSVKDIIIEAFADSADQDTLRDIAEILEIELTKEISWEATIHVSGTMQVSLLEDYDFESELNDNLSVDSQHGDISVENYEIANCQEAY